MPPINLGLDNGLLAQAYDRTSVHQFSHGKILVGSLGLKSGARVLDIGAGTGRLGSYVADIVGPEGEVVGVDPLPLRVDLARRTGKPNFDARVGRAEDLSEFESESFDAAYLNSVFHWIERKELALSEAHRVLRRGGRIALNSAITGRPHQSAGLVKEILQRERLDGGSTSSANFTVDPQQLNRLLHTAGFVDIAVKQHVFVDFHKDVDSLLEWSRSSSFGNFLSGLGAEGQQQLRAALAERLEEFRTPEGIRLERYLVFANARKP